jgi:hypothetical protein
MERELFTFADERSWSDQRVIDHFNHLRAHLETSPLTDERKRTINREITHIAFEGLQREQLKRNRELEIAWMEESYVGEAA